MPIEVSTIAFFMALLRLAFLARVGLSDLGEHLAEGKEKKERTNNYTWEIPNSMAFNSNTNKEYLTLANVPHGHNTKRKYVVEKPNGDVYTTDNLDSEKELIQDSYFNRKGNSSEVKYVSLENVVRIANYGTKVF